MLSTVGTRDQVK